MKFIDGKLGSIKVFSIGSPVRLHDRKWIPFRFSAKKNIKLLTYVAAQWERRIAPESTLIIYCFKYLLHFIAKIRKKEFQRTAEKKRQLLSF